VLGEGAALRKEETVGDNPFRFKPNASQDVMGEILSGCRNTSSVTNRSANGNSCFA
jgi:hypothetical protein